MTGLLAIGVFGLIGLPLTVLLGLISSRLTRGRAHRGLACGMSFALIPLVCLYLAGAAWAWNGWLSVRGLDEGMFDTFMTPLGQGYSATSVDSATPEGQLEGPGIGATASVVWRAGCAGQQVVLELNAPGPGRRYALISRLAPHYRELATLAALDQAANGAVSWSADRRPPLPCAPRQTVTDWAVRGALLGVPVFWALGIVLLIRAVRRESPEGMAPTGRQQRLTAALLALTLGTFGAHDFYLNRRRVARLKLTASLVGLLLGLLIVPLGLPWALGLLGIVQGIGLLRQGKEPVLSAQ